MVTSNKGADRRVIKMFEPTNIAVVPQRTLLGEVNEHITCPLCRGYYIDATTIVECLHSFCRSCIIKHLQVKSYCPVCEMMINSAKPNIKVDKALQDIVYKLVPCLFQKEMERRQHFYSSRPGPAASATPEQRGEDTERIIFSPEDVISFSLEYADVTDTDSISSKSSDSNEHQMASISTRRFLQCPAVVNISHLKKFLGMKFDIDSTQYAIDILYKRVPLPDYYTLMDIAYIYNWKRNQPMHFFYQIIDYIAIRTRLFDINRKKSHFQDRKSSPVPTEDKKTSGSSQKSNDQGSETLSGNYSPSHSDNSEKKANDIINKNETRHHESKQSIQNSTDCNSSTPLKKQDEEVEKSQFLNSFELTAKNNGTPVKSPIKANINEGVLIINDKFSKPQTNAPKAGDTLKRKQTVPHIPEMKRLKIELEKTKSFNVSGASVNLGSNAVASRKEGTSILSKSVSVPVTNTANKGTTNNNNKSSVLLPKEVKPQQLSTVKQLHSDNHGIKRTNTAPENISSPKRKHINEDVPSTLIPSASQNTVSSVRHQVSKIDIKTKSNDTLKPSVKMMPDLKPNVPASQTSFHKGQQRDLLANNSDPTIDRSKILNQVKSSFPLPSGNITQSTEDPLKSLFDSCKISIPSSLSITLTDQNIHNLSNSNIGDREKCITNLVTNATSHKLPTPPVHNYIEILKLPEINENSCNKTETAMAQTKTPNKPESSSAKGPVPNLKPIADTKLGKQSGNISAPITFQQTFEQQLHSMQSDKKAKVPRNVKPQMPKLVPATPKAFNAASKVNNPDTKLNQSDNENKSTAVLDLSSPHNVQSQLGHHQTRKLETMQSIANLAKKQNISTKSFPLSISQGNMFSIMSNRSITTSPCTLRIPTSNSGNQMKVSSDVSQTDASLQRENKSNQMKLNNIARPTSSLFSQYQMSSYNFSSTMQSSSQSHTRSPSSSPKLVIAEEKQTNNASLDLNTGQSNIITNIQHPTINVSKSESPKVSPVGSTKLGLKPLKPTTSGKITEVRPSLAQTMTMKPNPTMSTPADFLLQPQFMAHHAFMAQQIDNIQNAWFKARNMGFLKNPNLAQQSQDDYNKSKE